MELKIENYLIVKSATIGISDGITLIASGHNGAGKTSVLNVLQALVTGGKMPLAGLAQKDAAILTTEGAKNGKALLTWPAGGRELKWPSCEVAGGEFKCSKYAAGQVKPVDIPAKELAALIGVTPTKEQLVEHMGEPIPAEIVEKVWATIQSKGWDAAHDDSAAKGRDFKRDWRKLAGMEWGKVQAMEFCPENYTAEPLKDLTAALKGAEKAHEQSIKSAALNERDREELEKLAADHELGVTSGELEEKSDKLAALNTEVSALQQAVYQLLSMRSAQTYECWNCKKHGRIHEGKFVEADSSAADDEAGKKDLSEKEDRLEKLSEARREVEATVRDLRIRADKCERAHKQLNAEVAAPAEAPGLSVEDAKAAVEDFQKRIHAHNVKTESDELDALIRMSLHMQDVLSPDGPRSLRKVCLAEKLTEFNAMLKQICEVANWPTVELDEYLQPRFGGRPYIVISTGQKMAANIALQVAFRQLDESEILIIDEVSQLDATLMNGLIELLSQVSVPSLIAGKFKLEEVPDLAAHSLGASYWCEGGIVRALSESEMAVPA